MKYFFSENLFEKIGKNHLFLDNDFLGILFKNSDFFDLFLSNLQSASLLIEPFTSFEFLRDNYKPEIMAETEEFLFNKEFFTETIRNQEFFLNMQKNALLLSKIFVHQKQKKGIKEKVNASFVDLIIGATLMCYYQNALLITGNNKDFLPPIFKLQGLISIQHDSGSIESYSILSFDKNEFDGCYTQWRKIFHKAEAI